MPQKFFLDSSGSGSERKGSAPDEAIGVPELSNPGFWGIRPNDRRDRWINNFFKFVLKSRVISRLLCLQCLTDYTFMPIILNELVSWGFQKWNWELERRRCIFSWARCSKISKLTGFRHQESKIQPQGFWNKKS
ncbi:MAG: hypothetical protein A2827_00370 [Candidatus Spechtbacteria bacterium RIFCSPHIGHO2_01_FULL_43_30]|uniref:Uncharacterized protein n=1 Tax=Candidatus Spechtbacteria bacterium RIFCSPHIGHO2_01_FULL_43_30 TaxID=1802158 RepID=A0A1G2H8D2_9BACT|nr:MAG: hypothetical protein A2827_00370 [Candidatus Spechtbacteria bacterium RIFCSPHIGHO2_01_FULL_43_30]